LTFAAAFVLRESPFDLAVTLRGVTVLVVALRLAVAFVPLDFVLDDYAADGRRFACFAFARRTKARTNWSLRIACQPATPCFFAICARSFRV